MAKNLPKQLTQPPQEVYFQKLQKRQKMSWESTIIDALSSFQKEVKASNRLEPLP